jgi:F-type H+-transporting ATPase subunit alpha
MTDGQIYLSPKLFELGILPAVDVGKSVSRVGGKAQLPVYRSMANLKLDYAQFEELENFARFGTRLDKHTRKVIEHGKRIRICLKQQELQPMSVPEQVTVLLALTSGLFDTVPIEKMYDAEMALIQHLQQLPEEIAQRQYSGKKLSAEDREAILTIAINVLTPYQDESDIEVTIK